MIVRVWSMFIYAAGVHATSSTESAQGRVFLKYSYKTLEIVCPDDKCRWSVPLPEKVFASLEKTPSKDLKSTVLSALKKQMMSSETSDSSDDLKSMQVNLRDETQKSLTQQTPFTLLEKKFDHDPYFGPALTKRFADYEVITCQVKHPDSAGLEDPKPTPRVLVTYAVKRVADDKGHDGISIKTTGDWFQYSAYTLETYSAKYANLGKVSGQTAAGFCYILTKGIMSIFDELKITLSNDKNELLDEASFEKLSISENGGEGTEAEEDATEG